MSRLGTKTYSRKQECKTSLQFDHLLSDKGNKPSTAKVSVAAVHRWGMTSFTSLRKTQLNGQKDIGADKTDNSKRMKLDSRVSSGDPFCFDVDAEFSSVNPQTSVTKSSSPTTLISAVLTGKTACSKPNKFFKSGGTRLFLSTQKKPDFDAIRLSISRNYSVASKSESEKSVAFDNISSRCIVPSVDSQNRQKNYSYISNLLRTDSSPLNTSICSSSTFSADGDITANTQSHTHVSNESIFHRPFSSSERDSSCVLSTEHRESDMIDLHFERSSKSSDEDSELLYSTIKSNVCRTYTRKGNQWASNSEFHEDEYMKHGSTLYENKPVCEEKIVNECTQSLPQSFVPHIESDKTDSVSEESLSTISEAQEKTESIRTNLSTHLLHENESSTSKEKLQRNLSHGRRIFSNPKKHKAIYNHRHWQNMKGDQEDENEEMHDSSGQTTSLVDEFEEDLVDTEHPVLIREEHPSSRSWLEPVTSVKCPRKVKELYTVVKNVKQAYQCHESGETQEFNDDVEYLLESVQESNGIGTRCLSVISLATKCMVPAFRIHLRAHGTIPKVFSALQDAPLDTSLSLCTATLMFVLSQDRLTMDLEASTLSLMLQLLETDPQHGGIVESNKDQLDEENYNSVPCAQQEKHREKIYQLCEQMKQKGHAKHLKLNNINTGNLAMETLLSLTSRKAGEWFKEELRNLHGLDHIMDTVDTCLRQLGIDDITFLENPTEMQLDKLRKIDRCLRVLENVTYMNSENQEYLFNYRNSLLITSCVSMLQLCRSTLTRCCTSENQLESTSKSNDTSKAVIFACLLSLLKVLLNITHENAWGSSHLGSQDGLIECVLLCILQVPRAVSLEGRFDLLVLSLGLLINLVERCQQNRQQLVETYVVGSFDSPNDGYELSAMEALVEVLLSKLEAARLSEEQADALLSSQEEKEGSSQEKEGTDQDSAPSSSQTLQADDLEETLMKALQKAGKHMEHSIIAAYIAILLGCVIENNQNYADVLRDHMPDGKFDVMIDVLRKFLSFVSLTGVVGSTGVKSIQRVIDVLESS